MRRRGGHQSRGRRWRQRGYSRRTVRFLEPTLLLLLHQGPAHGYTLSGQLSEFDLEDINSSIVYRALRTMEEKGWVTSTWEEEQTQGPPRRVYCLTKLGDEVLEWWTQDLKGTKAMIDRILNTYHRHMEEGQGPYHNSVDET